MMTKHFKPSFQTLLATSVFLAIFSGLYLANRQITMSNQQSCLNLAQTHTVTEGNGGNGKWSVQEVSVNNAVYQDCISKKGL
jgi:hypothetical protein